MRLLLAILMLSVTLAGCSEDPEPATDPDLQDLDDGSGDDDPTTDDGSEDAAGGTSGDPSNDPSEPKENTTNAAPSLQFDANVTSGAAPLLVNFTIAGSDPDGDDLTWALDADGDGTVDAEGDTLPGSFEFAFDAGNFTAVATLTDGADTVNRTLNITALEATTPPSSETWYLYYPVPDGSCGDKYMSLLEGQDMGGCGNLAAGATGPAGAYWHAFPADAPSSGHAAGTDLSFSIGEHFGVGVAVGFEWRLVADGAVVAQGAEDLAEPMVPFVLNLRAEGTGTLAQAVPAGATLSFEYYLVGPAYWEGPGDVSTLVIG